MSPDGVVSVESMDLPEVPGYRVIAPVGAGSRGAVFRARELATQDLVALKVMDARSFRCGPVGSTTSLRAKGASALTAVKEALEEALRRLAAVESDVLLKPRELLAPGGTERLVLVMEFVEGDSLALRLGRSLRLVPERAARIAVDVAGGLGAAFDAGLVHGALHPGKIIPGKDGARLLGTGLGETLPAGFETPAGSGRVSPHVYAPDEVLAGDAPSAASDVFGLGAVLYHMLTGHAPWDLSGLAALRVARADGPLVWPRGSSELIPAGLMNLVDRMTSREPAARPAGGWMLAAALESALRKAAKTRPRRRPARPVLERPPPDVAPVETLSPAGAGTTRSSAGLLERVREYLARPSAIRVLVGGATAVFLLAVALALRPPPEGGRLDGTPKALIRSESTPGEPGPVAEADSETEEPSGAEAGPADQAPADPALEEIRTIEGVLAENPGDMEILRERLEALGSEAGEVGVRATLLLARITENRRKRAEGALRRVADRAAALEAGGRYGDAVAALERFPFDRFAGTPAAEKAGLLAEAIRGRAASAFAEVERGTEPLLARGDFAAARAEYEYLRRTVGIPTWVERAEAKMAEIGRMEEQAAEAAVARRRAGEEKRLAREVEKALAGLPRLCREFKYSKAERLIDALLTEPLAEKDRKRLAEYVGYVRREAEQFRLAGERVREGSKVVRVSFRGMPRDLIVRDVTEQGLVLSGLDVLSEGGDGTMTTRVSWRRVGRRFPYEFMLKVVNLTSFDERIALAVFACHRGLATAVENELTVAKTLAQSRWAREFVAKARAFLSTDPFSE